VCSSDLSVLLIVWLFSGLFYSAIITPSGRLLRRSAHAQDRPSLFAAQFALSHACWLFAYPMAGYLGHAFGMGPTMIVLGLVAAVATAAGYFLWPYKKDRSIEHSHDDLPQDHPHLLETDTKSGTHRHAFIIDDEHRVWPTQG